MNILGNQLLDAALLLGDVRAAAVLAPNRGALARVNDAALTEALLAPVWRHVSDAAEVSAHHRLPPQQMRWIFERVLVYCHRRADGLMLALVVGRAPGGRFDAAAAERLFEEFRKSRDA
jgi:hypothetical protein